MKNKWWNSDFILGVRINVISGLIVVVIVSWFGIDRVINIMERYRTALNLRYAQNFQYPDGTTYKGATSDVDNMGRDVDRKTPIPLNIDKEEQSIVFGVSNHNLKPIDNVRLWVTFPKEFTIIRFPGWIHNAERQYLANLGTISGGTAINPDGHIDFIVEKTGKYPFKYAISSNNFGAFTQTGWFDVYSVKGKK